MNKLSVQQALARLQDDARAYQEEYRDTSSASTRDTALVRRFMNAERREIIILRRYVLLGAAKISDLSNGIHVRDMDGLVAEMREAAKPKRRKT